VCVRQGGWLHHGLRLNTLLQHARRKHHGYDGHGKGICPKRLTRMLFMINLAEDTMTGRIFDIQRFSLHDGPGIRTTVFFKGCNLRCYWCHNPESVSPKSELQNYPAKCIGCGQCLKHCPHGALSCGQAGIIIDRTLCIACGECVKECYACALVLAGSDAMAEEVMDTVLRDRVFFENSGGGVTFSGGEPMLQHDFLKELLVL
jgi:pyruvate formate lyase activating enzyme